MADYFPESDRFDVALRVVVGMATGKYRVRGIQTWDILAELGLVRKECELEILVATDLIESLRTEVGLAQLLKLCPYVLPAALELLRKYQSVTCESRYSYYHTGSRKRMEQPA